MAEYPSNLTDSEWKVFARLLPETNPKRKGRPAKHSKRAIVNGILYIVRSGASWRMLPNDLPPWKTCYHYFRIWAKEGLWESIHNQIRDLARLKAGKKKAPTAAILDSQSVRTASHPGIRGYDAGKKITGRKRHALVDTLGLRWQTKVADTFQLTLQIFRLEIAQMKQLEEKTELTDLEKADFKTGKMMGGIALKAPGWGTGKRRRFVFEDRVCHHHLMSRCSGGDFLFKDVEKEAFRKIMRRLERFLCVDVLTYAVMGNHFHILLRVPEREKILAKFEKGTKEEREDRFFEHLKILYSRAYISQLRAELALMEKQGMDELYEKTIQGYLKRFCSMSHFMKELKETFSRWFNKRHGRRGTLWQERYRSVLVEDGEALQTMAAYIDLNPVRADLVDDPKDYRWCGYAEALGGSKRARRGLSIVMETTVADWESVARERYRRLLLGDGIEAGDEVKAQEKRQGRKYRRRGMNREKSLAELRDGKSLSKAELLRCRVRYFSDGLVLGSREFVERAFEEKRGWFGPKRKTGARGLPVNESQLFSLRDLKVRALE